MVAFKGIPERFITTPGLGHSLLVAPARRPVPIAPQNLRVAASTTRRVLAPFPMCTPSCHITLFFFVGRGGWVRGGWVRGWCRRLLFALLLQLCLKPGVSVVSACRTSVDLCKRERLLVCAAFQHVTIYICERQRRKRPNFGSLRPY